MPTVARYDLPKNYHPYGLQYSPHTHKLAIACSENFGLSGRGALVILDANAEPGRPPHM